MRRLLICSMIALMSAASATADSKQLKGAYAFTGSADCIVTDKGFNSFHQVNPPGGPQAGNLSFSVIGVRTFDGKGNGTVKGTAFGITPRPTLNAAFAPAAGTAEFSFSFTYSVDGEGGWTSAMVLGSFKATHVTGPRSTENPANLVNQTSTIDEIPPIVGLISDNAKTLIAAHTTPKVETVTYSDGDVEQRICHRSRVFVSIK